MNTKDAIKSTMDFCLFVMQQYVSDLSNAELLQRPGPGCNHLAWQIGHVIASEAELLNGICPGKAAALPPGFSEQHAKATAGSDDPAKFLTREQYLNLFATVRQATLAAIDGLSDSDLDKPAPESLRGMFPTVGAVITLIATHPMMHAGQFVIVRRRLGKPMLI